METQALPPVRLHILLPPEIAERLREEEFNARTTKTAIVIAALERLFFAPEAEQEVPQT
jgi:hypothetical protein